jgi:hypothetical protein
MRHGGPVRVCECSNGVCCAVQHGVAVCVSARAAAARRAPRDAKGRCVCRVARDGRDGSVRARRRCRRPCIHARRQPQRRGDARGDRAATRACAPPCRRPAPRRLRWRPVRTRRQRRPHRGGGRGAQRSRHRGRHAAARRLADGRAAAAPHGQRAVTAGGSRLRGCCGSLHRPRVTSARQWTRTIRRLKCVPVPVLAGDTWRRWLSLPCS